MKLNSLMRMAALLAGGALAATVAAQSSDQEPVPHQPLVSRVPNGASCLVTYRYKGDAKPTTKPGASAQPPPERIDSVKLEKQGAVCRQVTTFTSGATRENWVVDGQQICKNTHSQSYNHVTSGNPLYVDFTSGDFDELSWIGMDNYQGVTGAEKKTFVFEVKNTERRPTAKEKDSYDTFQFTARSAAAGKGGSAEQQKASAQAGVAQFLANKYGSSTSHATLDTSTQLPIEYDDGRVVRSYTFSSDSERLSSPLGVMHEIQSWKNLVKATTVRPSPP